MNYETEIEQLNEERKKAAERINELMKMRDVKNNMTSCKDEGHVWGLTGVVSDMWLVGKINLACTRCHGEMILETNQGIYWEKHEIEMLKDLVDQE